MSVRVVVQRGDGAHPGPDLIEPLLATPAVAIAAGRAMIDEAAAATRLRHALPYRGGVRPGHLVEVRDSTQGRTYRALVSGVVHRGDGARVTTELEVRRA